MMNNLNNEGKQPIDGKEEDANIRKLKEMQSHMLNSNLMQQIQIVNNLNEGNGVSQELIQN